MSAVGTAENRPRWSPPRRTEPWVSSEINLTPFCRRPARTLSEVEGEAPRKDAFVFVAPRVALRDAPAAAWKRIFFVLPRVPSAAADSTLGYRQACRIHRGTPHSATATANARSFVRCCGLRMTSAGCSRIGCQGKDTHVIAQKSSAGWQVKAQHQANGRRCCGWAERYATGYEPICTKMV